jgi:hypothetical protein
MISLGGATAKIHLATEPIDLRRGYSGLYTLVDVTGHLKTSHSGSIENQPPERAVMEGV